MPVQNDNPDGQPPAIRRMVVQQALAKKSNGSWPPLQSGTHSWQTRCHLDTIDYDLQHVADSPRVRPCAVSLSIRAQGKSSPSVAALRRPESTSFAIPFSARLMEELNTTPCILSRNRAIKPTRARPRFQTRDRPPPCSGPRSRGKVCTPFCLPGGYGTFFGPNIISTVFDGFSTGPKWFEVSGVLTVSTMPS